MTCTQTSVPAALRAAFEVIEPERVFDLRGRFLAQDCFRGR
jgi:hypothetical protein